LSTSKAALLPMLPRPAIIVRKLNNEPLDATHPKAASIRPLIPDILKDSIVSLNLAEKVDQLEKKVAPPLEPGY
jgi:hypothetical protein